MKKYRTIYDNVADAVCILLLLGTTVWLGLQWNAIPEQVPVHYNALGEIDNWGEKVVLLILPWILYGVFLLIGAFPQTWNIPISVTEANRERVYSITSHFVSTLKMEIVAFLTAFAVLSALVLSLPLWVPFILIGSVISTIIYYLVRLFRAK